MKKVIFACIHNAGRSQMAAAFFNAAADRAKAHAISAGTKPGDRVHPEVVTVMSELGIDVSRAIPRRLTDALTSDAAMVVTMGCGDECPYVAGVIREDWPLDDPKGRPLDEVRRIRDEIRQRVTRLLDANRWR